MTDDQGKTLKEGFIDRLKSERSLTTVVSEIQQLPDIQRCRAEQENH
jgi:hypothetical protein